MGGYTFACLILYDKKTDAWSAQIPFVFDGIHPQLYRQEVEQILTALYKGMGELPNCEYLTFIMTGRSHTRHRKQQLQSLAKGCNSDAIAVLTLNEQQRVKEISESGARQVWAQTIWCSWTAARSTEARTDEIGKALLWLQKHYQNWIRSFVGTQQTHFNDFYSRLARELYESGFGRWKNLLETKNSLQIRPMAVDELWEWLWYKFNSRQAPKLPQCIRIAETESGLSEDIPISGQKDLLTLLIQGDRGGHPVYVDILDSQKGRVLITGKTGSGKSVVGWRFLQEALAQGVPVVGLDLSAGGNSTFATAVRIMGEDRAAWIDILQSRLNILEPPYLGNLPTEVQLSRLKRWKDLVRTAIVAIAMGEIHDPKLRDRVDSICLRLIDIFFKDTVIVNRYNEAFEGGWRSLAWQDMPTLHDLLTFCSPQKLQLESVGDMDEAAINQILSQVGAKLRDPNIGGVIGRPSSVSPDAAITFYALSGLSNEQNAFIMAIVAQMACLRNALGHSRSMFVGDELSVLLSKRGFASLVGELLATGRKEGISVLMLAQDLDAIVDCDAAAQILANLSTVITGLTTYAATNTYEQSLGYPKEIISRNATDAYKANPAQLYTRWLIERNKRFWDTRFYAAPMMLAALANSEQEKAARMRILENFEPTELGYLQGLRAFADEYVQALRGSKRLQDIGRFQEGGWGAGSGGASLKRKSRGVGREGALNSPYSLLPSSFSSTK